MRASGNRKIFDFIIFSNLFIALCAVLMAVYTSYSFSLGIPPFNFLFFIFFSTLASYSIHWYLTDEATEITAARTSWLARNKTTHFTFFIISAIGCAIFLLQELGFIKWILPAVFLTLLYTAPKFPFRPFSALKKIIWGKTILLALMWTYVTSLLPFFITGTRWNLAYLIFFINRFTLIFPICILFDLRDKEFDKATGVKSLVTLLSHEKIKKIFTGVIIFNLLTIPVLSHFVNFYLTDNFILLIPTALTFLLYSRATKTKNDYLFYFILDGLMALSPILYFLKLYLTA